jgi:hypothetical protein
VQILRCRQAERTAGNEYRTVASGNWRWKSVGPSIAVLSRMADRRTAGEMIGEFLREAAVLVAVFLPLDRMLTNSPLTLGWYVAILGLSGSLLGVGILVELW